MKRLPNFVVLVAVLLLGIAIGAGFSLTPAAMGEVERRGENKNVPSGGLKSAATLEKMQTTLQSIDERLKKIESHTGKLAAETEK